MNNKSIILNERIRLMEEGKIGKTGKMLRLKMDGKEEKVLCEPEPVHTKSFYADRGRRVRDGEKGFVISIWKAKEEDGTGEKRIEFCKVSAHFYTMGQTEKMEVGYEDK